VTENPPEVPASPGQTCVQCSKPLEDGWEYCPACGTKTVPLSTPSAIDAYVQNKVNLAISSRLTDQASLVREIGDKAEDIVWKRLKQYGVLFGLLLAGILGFIAFLGIKTLDDVSKRIEPILSAAEQRAQAVKGTTEETAARVEAVKASLDQLSRDVAAQTQRVAEKGGEISNKLDSLNAAADKAQKRAEQYQARAEELSQNVEAMTKGLETRVEQVSKQIEDVSIRKAYPSLGQQFFVTYNGERWKDKAEKGQAELWFNIYLHPLVLGEIFPEQLKKLMEDVKRQNVTPLLGMFGIGGPYSTSFSALGDTTANTALFYFNKELTPIAMTVGSIVSEDLSIKGLKPTFVDPSSLRKEDMRRFVIEQSGLDLQLYVYQTAAKQ
jgi:archaellum component FlaC